ncbi:MAG TPA: replication-relaxation family protein [Ktedonobacteraceae bacterium]|nr:replication-relaxation family protein [Ktedonobacteraceae bacterium]
MTTHSFADHIHAYELFLKAKEELRSLVVEHGLEASEAFDLIVRSYTYNPLMLRYYAPTLHAWALKPVPPPPTPEPVKTYHEELQAALERITVLENERIAKQEEVNALLAQTVTPASDALVGVEEIAIPVASGNGSSIPTGSITTVGASSDPDETTPLTQDTPQEKEVAPQEVIEALHKEGQAPAPPAYDPDGAILGRDVETGQLITIGEKARQLGMFLIGGNGTGKSSLVVQALLHDADKGLGLAFFDPHGSAIEQFLLHCPAHRLKDVILIEPGNTKIKHSIGLNLITRTPGSVDADAARLMDVFKRLWGPESGDNQSWGPRMENLLRSSIYVFLALGLTLAELPHFLKNSSFRKDAFSRIPPEDRNMFLEDFWETDYEPLSKHEKEVWAGPLMNKLFALLTAPEVMKIIAQPHTTIDFRKCMDESKIILVHLNENLVGRDAQHFIGTTLIAELIKSVRSRSPEQDNRFFTIAIDEFAKFASSEFVEAVPELRKYGCGFLLLSQFFHQLETDMQGAVKQMATQITFRVAPDDAALRAWLYYRDPKPITREVERKLPAKRCIDQLVLAGRPHTNDEVTMFFFGLEEVVRMDSRPTTTKPGGVTGYSEYISYPSRLGPKSYFKFHKTGYTPAEISPNGRSLEVVNEFFFQVMKENNARLVFPRSELNLVSLPHDLSIQLGKNMLGLPVAQEMVQTDGTPYTRFPLALLTDELYAALWQVNDDALPAILKQCWEVVYSDIAERIKARVDSFAHDYLVTFDNNSEMIWSCRIPTERTYALAELPLNRQPLFASSSYTYKRNEDGTDIWLDFEKNELTVTSIPDEYQEFDQEAIKKIIQGQLSEFFRSVKQVRITFLLNDPRFDPHTFTWQPHREHQAEHYGISRWVFGENEAFSTLFADSIAQKAIEITDSFLYRFTETVRLTRRLCDALVADPIMVGTGEMEEIVTGKQPVQDAVNEMAGNIIDLPNYTAYVRLPPNGGLSLNRDKGATDTTYKPRMETLPLPAGVDETILPERKKQAHNQTLAQGFATPTKTILQVITDRRARFGIGTEGKQQPKQEPKEKPQQQDPVQEDSSTKGKSPIKGDKLIDEKASPNGDLYPIGNKLTEEKQPQSAEPVVTPALVDAPTLLQVSRAGTYAATTLPLTPHPVALPAEKTTPDAYAALLYHFAYLSLEQATLLTGKGSSIDYERKKINKLIIVENKQVTDKGLITSQPDKSSDSSGKARLCYSLTAKGYKHLEATQQLPPRKKGNLAADTLAVNDALITLVLAARVEQSITLVSLQQEKVFEQTTIKLPDGKELSPDGLLTFRVNGAVRTLAIEVDSGSEQKSQVVEKVSKYLQAFQGPYQERTGGDSVTVVFCIPNGVDKDIARLVGILETALKQHKEAAPLFLVGVLPDGKAIPSNFLTQSVWSQPFSPDKHALIA